MDSRWGVGARGRNGCKGWRKHLQLQTEGGAQHLKSFHLKVHSDGGLVILIKGVSAEPKGAPDALALSLARLAKPGPTLPSPTQLSSSTLLPINETSLPHRQVPHHNDLGDLKSAGTRGGRRNGLFHSRDSRAPQ